MADEIDMIYVLIAYTKNNAILLAASKSKEILKAQAHEVANETIHQHHGLQQVERVWNGQTWGIAVCQEDIDPFENPEKVLVFFEIVITSLI